MAAKKKAAKKKATKKTPAKTTAKKAVARRKPGKRTVAKRRPAPPVVERRRTEPESLRLRSAGPSFTVNDIAKSLAWYRDVLGFTVGERWEHEGMLRGVELLAGQVRFWLSQDDWKKGRVRVKGEGLRIHCETGQDVDDVAARAKAQGGTLLEEPHDDPWGGRNFAVTDPDGFKITIANEARNP
jgi:catechol 2,3-dioxygenase-like lactoylglutathione lyase family enzyme